jgi:hypothetical protein
MAYTTIDNPKLFFNTVLYTGDLQDSDGTGHTQSITGVGFQPDWVWHKGRSGARTHMIVDRVRGVSSYNWLASNGSGAELTTNTNGAISSIDSDGITVQNGNDSSSKSNNAGKNGETWVFWNWLAGGTTSSNGNGSITSTVSVNSVSGFSIVSYTGTGSNATVGHGLGVAPSLIINKCRSASQNWATYHAGIGATKAVFLDGTDAATTSSSYFNDTAPTSSVFTVGSSGDTNKSSQTHISYCFAEKKGFSKFSTYEGNGSSDGPFVHTGFKPAFLITKRADTGGDNWHILDSTRDIDNPAQEVISANANTAEGTTSTSKIDFLSNGFKCRGTGSSINTDGLTYIYIAFAENPFVTAGTKAAGTAR